MKRAIILKVNGTSRQIDANPAMPLLWVLRERLGFTGTDSDSHVGACGACAIHIDGEPLRARLVRAPAGEDSDIVDLERLPTDVLPPRGALRPEQEAWVEMQVPQCGYCQSSMIMAMIALLRRNPHPTHADVDEAITGHCRCGTCPRIRYAFRTLASEGTAETGAT